MAKAWIQTASGQAFDLLNPDPTTVLLPDIAHALARICRYTGHVLGAPYSVAQHCVNVAALIKSWGGSELDQRVGLAHDFAEAYTGDVASPIKMAMRELHAQGPSVAPASPFDMLDRRVTAAVCSRFVLPAEASWPACVKMADTVMLLAEARDLLGPPPQPWGFPENLYQRAAEVAKVSPWPMARAERELLDAADRLGIV